METGRFDSARVRQSIEEGLTRLGLDEIPLLHLHDPEHARELTEVTCDGVGRYFQTQGRRNRQGCGASDGAGRHYGVTAVRIVMMRQNPLL